MPQDTLLVFSRVGAETIRRELDATWCYKAGEMIVVVAKDDAFSGETPGSLEGAYSPVVLSRVRKGDRRRVCRTAVHAVYIYYGLELEGDDVEEMVEIICYRVKHCTLPLTTQKGILRRGLGWMETLVACDYTKLPQLAGSISGAHCATSVTLCANFSAL